MGLLKKHTNNSFVQPNIEPTSYRIRGMSGKILTSAGLMKEKLQEYSSSDHEKIIVIFELPFVEERDDIKSKFAKKGIKTKKVEILRSGALVFSSAVVELPNKKTVQKALQMLTETTPNSEYDVIALSAVDFLAGKPYQEAPVKKKGGNKEDCIIS